MKFIQIVLLTVIILVTGKLSAQTCSGLTGIINTYAPVTTIAGNVVTRGTTTGAAAPFAVGDYVLLIQMTGPPPAQTGSNMGKYELRTVTAVSGNNITLDGIVNTYTTTERVQIVRVPYCPTATISGTVTAKEWDFMTGGIVALKGTSLTMNANIDVTAKGYSVTNKPHYIFTSGTGTGIGSTDGRGKTGSGTGAGVGGGGIGGGGGDGGNNQGGDGGSIGGSGGAGLAQAGQLNYSGKSGFGVDGGTGSVLTTYPINGGGGGGGGGVIGGGGGGGGGNYEDAFTTYGGGGGGGVTGGGGGGFRNIIADPTKGAAGGGGGGPMGVGTGASANYTDSGGGGGGGSYGGGGGSASSLAGGDDSNGGGGGGSWTGGGIGGTFGANPYINVYKAGANGNDRVSLVIPSSAHYLNTTQARLMLGGGGGNSTCRKGGLGGGMVFLEFTSVSGNNFKILANGETPLIAPATCAAKGDNEGAGGAGGGGGGQMVLNVKNFTSFATIEAKGGKGGDANYNVNGSGGLWHGGTGGAGGGGGGIWIYGAASSSNTGSQTVTVANTNLSGAGATLAGVGGGNFGARTTNPKNDVLTGTGGAGGNGLIIQSPDVPAWPVPCTISLTAASTSCNPVNNQYSVTGSITFSNPPSSGTLTVSIGGVQQTFNAPLTSPQAYTLSGLISDGASHTVSVSFSADAACTNSTTYTAPTNCTLNPCTVSLTAVPGTCNPANTQYSVTGSITFSNPPSSGTLTVSIGAVTQVFNAPFTSPQAYTLSGLTSDGASHTVSASFSADANCTNTTTYAAPFACQAGACSVSLTATPGTCNTANNNYSVTGSLTFSNAPSNGTLTVVSGSAIQTFNSPFTSPQAYTLSGLTSDGASHSVTATFSVSPTCTGAQTYTAPATCNTSCPSTNYTLCPGESYTLTAEAGLTNYQWYTISGIDTLTIAGATNQIYITTAIGKYLYKAKDGAGCDIKLCCPIELVVGVCNNCDITELNLVVGNCNNKGTLSNITDDEYTFTLNPTGSGIGASYTVTGLPNSPQTGTYGSPTTFGPYLISAGALSIAVVDDVTNTCSKVGVVNPPPSCSGCTVAPPVLTVSDNVCPSRTGSINIVQDCGAGSYLEYSTNNGLTWSTAKPLYTTTAKTILARCVNTADPSCKSTHATATTNPQKCPGGVLECTLIASTTAGACQDNATADVVADDYFMIQVNASASNAGSAKRYEVVLGADPTSGLGGNVLNSGGTMYGSPVTVGQNKQFKADGSTSYSLIVRDIDNKSCFQQVNITPVAPCSSLPPKSPCYPVPCVPILLNKGN